MQLSNETFIKFCIIKSPRVRFEPTSLGRQRLSYLPLMLGSGGFKTSAITKLSDLGLSFFVLEVVYIFEPELTSAGVDRENK